MCRRSVNYLVSSLAPPPDHSSLKFAETDSKGPINTSVSRIYHPICVFFVFVYFSTIWFHFSAPSRHSHTNSYNNGSSCFSQKRRRSQNQWYTTRLNPPSMHIQPLTYFYRPCILFTDLGGTRRHAIFHCPYNGISSPRRCTQRPREQKVSLYSSASGLVLSSRRRKRSYGLRLSTPSRCHIF